MVEPIDSKTASQRGAVRTEVLLSAGLVCAFFLMMAIAFVSFRY
jgi:hypothetical protein